MGFSDDDQIMTENLYIFKGYGAKRLTKEFQDKGWVLHRQNKLLRKLKTPVRQREKVVADDLELRA